MSKLRIAIGVALVAALATGLALYGFCSLSHGLRSFSLNPKQVENVEIAFKGAMGEAILGEHSEPVPVEQSKGKTGLDALVPPVPGDNRKGDGLIAEYQRNPQKFKRYAEMLDTALHAKQVGEILLGQDSGSRLPKTSEALTIQQSLKLDAWGSPFCVISLGERLAVVSGGPSRVTCDALPLTAKQIASSKRSMYAGPSDVVVVIVARQQTGPPTSPRKTPI